MVYSNRFLKGNYKRTFEIAVDQLLDRDLCIQARLRATEELTESYAIQTGEVPDGKQLCRLADCLLREDLKNRHPDKVTMTELPILSGGQQRLRGRREITTEMTWMSKDLKFKLNGRRKTVRKKQQG